MGYFKYQGDKKLQVLLWGQILNDNRTLIPIREAMRDFMLVLQGQS